MRWLPIHRPHNTRLMEIQYLTTKQAMLQLNIKSDTTMRKWEKEGLIKAYRPNGFNKRYRLDQLEKALGKK